MGGHGRVKATRSSWSTGASHRRSPTRSPRWTAYTESRCAITTETKPRRGWRTSPSSLRPDSAAGASSPRTPACGKSPRSGPASSSTERVFSLDDPNASKTLKGLVLGRHLLSIRRRLHRPDPCFWRLRLQATRKDLA
ncbi:hypothetical protein BN13_10066 [Nostocoides jenkinsii Ben 74]|uniref:Uncharacterized protein n=1 Tax=Nostocoides jenkinsii Ben 74 TaxID=1193518 RepID=A0A077M9C0_9MICO|nr:hypothetical protein BN13_10066 [Tetrasphaera jenkinsii Ben 74]